MNVNVIQKMNQLIQFSLSLRLSRRRANDFPGDVRDVPRVKVLRVRGRAFEHTERELTRHIERFSLRGVSTDGWNPQVWPIGGGGKSRFERGEEAVERETRG